MFYVWCVSVVYKKQKTDLMSGVCDNNHHRVIFLIVCWWECEESQGIWFFVNIIVFDGFLESEGTWKPWKGRFCESFADFW